MKRYSFNGRTYDALWELRGAAPQFVFPPDPDDAMLAALGIGVEEAPEPVNEADPLTEAKQRRREKVAALEVAVDGMVFDGNETAQRRMSGALLGWADGAEKIAWVLADNSVAQVTKTQLLEALRLAVAGMSRLWVAPYGGGNAG